MLTSIEDSLRTLAYSLPQWPDRVKWSIIDLGREHPPPCEGRCLLVYDCNLPSRFVRLTKRAFGAGNPHVAVYPVAPIKTLANARRLWEAMQDARPTTCIILGGGATLDVAGFAASTYRRGVRIVCIPTTLMAMIDASIGGKVALDNRGAKNIIGSFSPAFHSYVHVGFLQGRPFQESKLETIEAVKFAFLGRLHLIKTITSFTEKWMNGDRNKLRELIWAAAKLKIESADIPGAAYLGHTLAHAIEGSRGLTHAEAVATGLLVEAQLAVALGLTTNETVILLSQIVCHIGLPRGGWPDLEPRRLSRLCERQKTYDGRLHTFQLYEGECPGRLRTRKILISTKELEALMLRIAPMSAKTRSRAESK